MRIVYRDNREENSVDSIMIDEYNFIVYDNKGGKNLELKYDESITLLYTLFALKDNWKTFEHKENCDYYVLFENGIKLNKYTFDEEEIPDNFEMFKTYLYREIER